MPSGSARQEHEALATRGNNGGATGRQTARSQAEAAGSGKCGTGTTPR